MEKSLRLEPKNLEITSTLAIGGYALALKYLAQLTDLSAEKWNDVLMDELEQEMKNELTNKIMSLPQYPKKSMVKPKGFGK